MASPRFALVLSVMIIISAMALPVSALSVDVQVVKKFSGELKDISMTSDGGLRKVSFEFFNSGSLPYRAIARLDFFEGENIASTSWSDYKALSPGERATFELFGYLDHSGNFTPRLRIYFANEIAESWYSPESYQKSFEPADIFNISNAVSGSDYIAFDVISPEDSDVIILAADYLPGWIFQQKAAHLSADAPSRQRLYYEADLPVNSKIRANIISSDGRSFSSQYIDVNTEENALGNIIDSLVTFASSFLR